MSENPVLFTLGDIVFGSAFRDSDGVLWRFKTPKGWLDSPDVSQASLEKSNADGAWYSEPYLREKIIELSGTVSALSREARYRAHYRLKGIMPRRKMKTLYVTEPGGNKQMEVFMTGKVMIEDIDDKSFSYSLMLVAPDPIAYSADGNQTILIPSGGSTGGMPVPFTVPVTIPSTVPSTAAGVAFNNGNTPVLPQVVVTGPCTNPTIINETTGEYMRAEITLGASDSMTFDFAHKQQLFNGVTPRDTMASGSNWFELEEGATALSCSASDYSSGCQFTVTWRSGWI